MYQGSEPQGLICFIFGSDFRLFLVSQKFRLPHKELEVRPFVLNLKKENTIIAISFMTIAIKKVLSLNHHHHHR